MRWSIYVFTLELRKIFSYRIDFWTQFLSHTIVWLTMSYFLWASIFEHQKLTSIGGYSFHGLMLYYLFAGGTHKIIMGEGIGMISREIYQGELNRYLIYPVSFFVYKFICHLAHSATNLAQLLFAFLFFVYLFGLPQEISVNFLSLLNYSIIILLSSYLYFSIAAVLEILAFWVDNVWSFLVMLRFIMLILGGALVPLVLFPEWAQQIISYLPFTYMLSFGVEIFLNQISDFAIFKGFLLLFAWGFIFNITFVILWFKGLKQYTGVGI